MAGLVSHPPINAPGAVVCRLASPDGLISLEGHSSVSLSDGRVLLCCGVAEGGQQNEHCYIIEHGGGTVSRHAPSKKSGSSVPERSNASMVRVGSSFAYLFGGFEKEETDWYDDTYCLNLGTLTCLLRPLLYCSCDTVLICFQSCLFCWAFSRF